MRLNWHILVCLLLAQCGLRIPTAFAQDGENQQSQQSQQDSQNQTQDEDQSQSQSQQGAKVNDQGSGDSQGEDGLPVRVKERKRRLRRQSGQTNQKNGDSSSSARTIPPQATANPQKIRRFHEVLDELLAEFGYDVKSGQIKGLSNVSIRKVRVSQAIPKSYEDFIEAL